ncbi:MAG: hypothetical protein M3Z08_10535 [Chloroflexota bacterium]|nr:hypothetical protein [Chloroflexota bacterium]
MDNRSFDQPPIQSDELPLDLQAAARSYAAQPVPRPSSAETAQLFHALLTEAAFEAQNTPYEGNQHLWHIAVLARWRVYLLGPWFWIASVLLLLAGILLARSLPVSDLITLLILLLPLTAVLSLVHALRMPAAGLRAVEASCPVNFAQTSMGLGLAILAFDSLLGLVATLSFTLANFAPFWNLLLAWLAPLLLLTAISLPIALLRNVRLAALIGGLPWLLLGLLALAEQPGASVAGLFFSLPQDTFSLASHLATIVLSLLLLLALFRSAPKWQRFCTL